ncbi:unnamed protein product [Microthlaspi erraticum]|uniref:Uncharacterized protein n=1 Tax=Microthlaspi erraticum TaxID=1685480 RepID=A0A6D2JAV3_9BRAS|nr:unnamed protein product [Microthlaspi erraticum]
MFLLASRRPIALRSCTIKHSCSYSTLPSQVKHRENNITIQQLHSLLHKNESNPRIIHQLHSHFTTSGLLLLHPKQNSDTLSLFNPLLRCYSLTETQLRAYFLYD